MPKKIKLQFNSARSFSKTVDIKHVLLPFQMQSKKFYFSIDNQPYDKS